jgi:hypothetical protein
MKKLLFPFLLLFVVIVSCKETVVAKPDKLIDENQMVDILYDLSLLDAMKLQNTASIKYPTSTEFIKKKYQIDSVTFAKNSQYYASDIANYKKIYEKVKARLSEQSQQLNGGKVPEQDDEQGIVK